MPMVHVRKLFHAGWDEKTKNNFSKFSFKITLNESV